MLVQHIEYNSTMYVYWWWSVNVVLCVMCHTTIGTHTIMVKSDDLKIDWPCRGHRWAWPGTSDTEAGTVYASWSCRSNWRHCFVPQISLWPDPVKPKKISKSMDYLGERSLRYHAIYQDFPRTKSKASCHFLSKSWQMCTSYEMLDTSH